LDTPSYLVLEPFVIQISRFIKSLDRKLRHSMSKRNRYNLYKMLNNSWKGNVCSSAVYILSKCVIWDLACIIVLDINVLEIEPHYC